MRIKGGENYHIPERARDVRIRPLPKPTTLDEILMWAIIGDDPVEYTPLGQRKADRAKAQIKSLFLSVVGADEELHSFSPKTQKHYFENLDMENRNQLRDELRKAISEL